MTQTTKLVFYLHVISFLAQRPVNSDSSITVFKSNRWDVTRGFGILNPATSGIQVRITGSGLTKTVSAQNSETLFLILSFLLCYHFLLLFDLCKFCKWIVCYDIKNGNGFFVLQFFVVLQYMFNIEQILQEAIMIHCVMNDFQ